MMTVRVPIRVKPGASRTRVGGRHDENELIVAVNVPPVDGAANAAVIAAVAKAIGVRKGDLSVVAGHTSRSKVLEITVSDSDAENTSRTVATLLDGTP